MKPSKLLSPGLILVCLIPLSCINAQIVINEFMSSNNNTIFDEDGDSSDWLEIFNTGGEPVSTAGYYLSDDEENLSKWPFPVMIIAPNSYLLIYCSSKNRSDINQPLHTNFKLNAEGEDIFLVKDNEIIQHISPTALDEDIAFAAFPDENRTFLNTSIASPGEANLLDLKVSFSLPAGFYENNINLFLAFNKPALVDLEIRYTLTGNEPSSKDFLFTDEIIIDNRSQQENILANIPCTPDFSDWNGENHYPAWASPQHKLAKGTVIRAAAFLGGQRISQTATHTYFVFGEGKDRYQFPVVSISCPVDSLFSYDRGIYVPGAALETDNMVWSGNYFNSGSDWERVSNFEYFVEGENVVNQLIGLRLHGGKTRGAAQKTLRLYARSSYGKSRLEYPFFSTKNQSSYKRLLLRTTMGSWTNTIITDAFAHQAARELNLDIQEYEPVIVFINGEYWGLHELRERFDQHKLADDYGLDEDSIRIYASYGDVIEGEEDTEFIFLRDQYLVQNDITDPAVYDYIKERIDIDHLIDYFFAEIFFNNPDWPGNNSKMWRSTQYDNKFRWLFYDIDGGMGENYIDGHKLAQLLGDNDHWEEDSWANAIIRTLIKNDDFKQQFIDRAKVLLQQNFNPETLHELANQMEAQYEGELDEHFQRWPNWLTTEVWRNNVYIDMKKFVLLRACEMEEQMVDYFNIDSFLECEKEPLADAGIYPNPTQGQLTISLDINKEGVYYCFIYNQLGQLLDKQTLILSSFGNMLDVSALSSGIYHISLFDAKMHKITTKSIVKI